MMEQENVISKNQTKKSQVLRVLSEGPGITREVAAELGLEAKPGLCASQEPLPKRQDLPQTIPHSEQVCAISVGCIEEVSAICNQRRIKHDVAVSRNAQRGAQRIEAA